MENKEYVFKSKIRIAISPYCNLKCSYCDNSHRMAKDRTTAMEDFRKTPICNGVIDKDTYIAFLKSFYINGFTKVNFTGGEPMLNKDWQELVIAAKTIGFESVEMTTNGTLISEFLNNNRSFPNELDRLIISIDTFDSNNYQKIIGSDKYQLNDIIDGIRRIKEATPNLKLTANCVLCKSFSNSIIDYIENAKRTGFDNITFLDLIVRDTQDQAEIDYFKKEFFSGRQVKKILFEHYGELPIKTGRHDFNVVLPNNIIVSVVDTKGLTRRDTKCDNCDDFCQEGLYTAKVATDGYIIDCLGKNGICIDGTSAIREGSLDKNIKKIYNRLKEGRDGFFFDKFLSVISQ